MREQGKGDDQAVGVRLRASTYEGACSALSHLYNDSGKKIRQHLPSYGLSCHHIRKARGE